MFGGYCKEFSHRNIALMINLVLSLDAEVIARQSFCQGSREGELLATDEDPATYVRAVCWFVCLK